jgi:hypothetical protein
MDLSSPTQAPNWSGKEGEVWTNPNTGVTYIYLEGIGWTFGPKGEAEISANPNKETFGKKLQKNTFSLIFAGVIIAATGILLITIKKN